MSSILQNNHYYVLLCSAKNLTVDLDNGQSANGTTVNGFTIHQYSANDPGQQVWQVVYDGPPDGDNKQWVRLVNRASGTTLDLKDGGENNGTPTQGWQWTENNDNQRWHFHRVEQNPNNKKAPAWWVISNKAASRNGPLRCLDMNGTPHGTPVVIWEADDYGTNQDQLFMAIEVET